MWFFKNKKKEIKDLYEIYFCDTMDIDTAFGRYTDYFKVEITTLEEAQHIISSKANGWGHCTVKVNDYIYRNYNDNTYFIIKKNENRG